VDKEARSWYVDETYVNVKGKWCDLYRAIDRDGNLVDSLLSEKRDMEAAQRFFKQAVEVVGHAPERVTTDGHDSYPRAIRETLGSDVLHRTNRSLNNRLEQDHRGIKQRYYPMRGFVSVASASRFCRAFDEVRQFFRVHTTMKQRVSLAQQREVFRHQLDALKAMMLVAYHPEMAGEKCPTHFLDSCVLSSDTSDRSALQHCPKNGRCQVRTGHILGRDHRHPPQVDARLQYAAPLGARKA